MKKFFYLTYFFSIFALLHTGAAYSRTMTCIKKVDVGGTKMSEVVLVRSSKGTIGNRTNTYYIDGNVLAPVTITTDTANGPANFHHLMTISGNTETGGVTYSWALTYIGNGKEKEAGDMTWEITKSRGETPEFSGSFNCDISAT